MKLEIEITEEEIKSALERKVRIAIADQTNQWNVDRYIKDQVAEHWKTTVDAMVQEALKDSSTIQEKIRLAIENRLKNQLTLMLKAKK